MATSMFHRIFFYTQKFYLGGIIIICLMSAPAIAKQWAPKYVNGVFSEIADPWVAPANGSSGAPRHGWLNTFDGFFTKEWHASYTFARNLNQSGHHDRHVGTFRLQLPLSSRAWVGLMLPTAHTRNTSNLGDISITPKLMLHETTDVSISAGVGLQLPTGKKVAGGIHCRFYRILPCGLISATTGHCAAELASRFILRTIPAQMRSWC